MSHLTISRRTLRKRCAAPRCRVRFAQVKSVVATFAAVVSLVVIGAPVVAAQGSVSIEYRSKATFLATFPSFVDWPDGAFASPTAPFIVCVLGDFHFGTTLAEVSRDSLPHGRRFSVRWVRNDQQLRGCHILFVSSSELSRYAKVIALVQGAGTFTVGETAGFLAAGGMLSMSFEHEAVQFEVNLASGKEAHFRVSSRLLALARHVVESTESTKS